MSVPEILRRYLDQKAKPTQEDYTDKLSYFVTPIETTLRDISYDNDFREHLKDCGLTSRQRAGVMNVFRNAGHVVLREEGQRYPESYKPTVGDIRVLSNSDLRTLTGEKGERILRRLFGRHSESEDEEVVGQVLPPFLERRFGRS